MALQEQIENRTIYVISVCDEDGYYVPVLAATSKATAWKKFNEWKIEHKDDPHWALKFVDWNAVELYSEEAE